LAQGGRSPTWGMVERAWVAHQRSQTRVAFRKAGTREYLVMLQLREMLAS
jgi:hypothetical protein